MAQENVESQKASPSSEEMRQWFEHSDYKNQIMYENTEEAAKLLANIASTTKQRSVASITKESLRTYLQAPTRYEKQLRDLSRYLYYRSQTYYRLVKYYSNMFDLNARSVVPPYSLVDKNDKKTMLSSYNDTLQLLETMNLQYEFLKAYTGCWRDDVFCGVAYLDEQGFFILPLDLDYCKIVGVYPDSSFAFAFDCSFFSKNPECLEYWGEPFESLNKEYENSKQKWQIVPPEYSVCLKVRCEDWETPIPPLSGLMEEVLNLINMIDNEAIADEEQIYKLLVAKIPLISGSNNPNDFAVNPTLALQYFNKMKESLPDYVGMILDPALDITPVSFDEDAASDTTKVAKATSALFNTAGGAQILNSATITGTTAYTGAMRLDSEFAISALLPQTEAIVNRLVGFQLNNPSKIKFFELTVYTKQEFKENLLQSAQYGLPTKIALNTLNGFSALDTMALNFLEEEVLEVTTKFVPLQSSYTQTGDSEGGRPTSSDTEITDDGESSRDKRDKANG